MIKRLLKMGMVITPIMIVSYLIGLPYGPKGVASAYSVVMVLWLVPLILWALHDAPVSPRDVVVEMSRPFISAVIAGVLAFSVKLACGDALPVVVRLVLECSTVLIVFLVVLVLGTGQKGFYLDLLRSLRRSGKEKTLVSA
jgi:PST family polysaccharide transporter